MKVPQSARVCRRRDRVPDGDLVFFKTLWFMFRDALFTSRETAFYEACGSPLRALEGKPHGVLL